MSNLTFSAILAVNIPVLFSAVDRHSRALQSVLKSKALSVKVYPTLRQTAAT